MDRPLAELGLPPPPPTCPPCDQTAAAETPTSFRPPPPPSTTRRPPPLPRSPQPPAEPPEPAPAPATSVETSGHRDRRNWLGGLASCTGSLVVHSIAFIALGLLTYTDPHELSKLDEPEPILVDMPRTSETEEEIQANELIQEIQAAASVSIALTSSEPVIGSEGSGSGSPISTPVLDALLLKQDNSGAEMAVPRPKDYLPSRRQLHSGVPDGALGDPRAVVDNYQQVLDRLTEEVLWMLAERKVLLIWCFDQSGSMKDDQQEIYDRIERIYEELGLRNETRGDALASAVVSYGEGFLVHTQPTTDPFQVKAAIQSVPSDPSGVEMMCQAVMTSIATFAEFAETTDRRMALVLVTDESGDRENNLQFLEPAIAQAKAARCRIYAIGREAVFGYPLAHMRWVHPQTGKEHWLPVDRGPESGLTEQLQIDGFRRRFDAHASGFGPYEQCRMARETGGIFFVLPSLESDLVRGEKREYELAALRPYRPDLRSRAEVMVEANNSMLRSVLYKIVHDLNPDDPELQKVMEVRYDFSPRPDQFVQQVAGEVEKARVYLTYLEAAIGKLEQIRYYRDQEPSRRWQANYDLVLAQLLAYGARTAEYIAYLNHFTANPKQVPATKPNYMVFSGWKIRESQTIVGPATRSFVDRSTKLFNKVLEEHAGTPWAARAEWELARGFGVELEAKYVRRPPPSPSPKRPRPRPSAPSRPKVTIPIPKL